MRSALRLIGGACLSICGCFAEPAPPRAELAEQREESIRPVEPAETARLADKLGGGSRDLKEGVVFGADILDAPRQRQVLVYYVNEPQPDIYRKLREWTAEVEDEEVRKAGWRIEQDLQHFPEAVEQEIASIRASAPAETGVAIFTNGLVRQGACLVKPIGSAAFEQVPFARPEPEAADRKYHPVTDRDVFAAAMEVLAEKFNPREHDFVLVTKAHGTPEAAMATMFGHVMQAESADEMLELIAEYRRQAAELEEESPAGGLDRADPLDKETYLDPVAHNTLNKDMHLDPVAFDTLNKDMGLDPMANDTLGGKLLLSGMSKAAYFQVLREASLQREMRFGIVFLEACRSELDRAESARLISSQPRQFIGILYTSDRTGLRYRTIDYDRLFAHAAEQRLSLTDAVRHHLDEFQKTQQPIPNRGELPAP